MLPEMTKALLHCNMKTVEHVGQYQSSLIISCRKEFDFNDITKCVSLIMKRKVSGDYSCTELYICFKTVISVRRVQ